MKRQQSNHKYYSAGLLSLLLLLALEGSYHGVLAEPKGDYQSHEMNSIPDLPGLPMYTGQAKLLQAVAFPNAQGMKAYTITLGVRERQQDVIQWYRDAFKATRWTVNKASPDPELVSAQKPGMYCKVLVGAPVRPGDNARVMIEYRSLHSLDLPDTDEDKNKSTSSRDTIRTY